MRPSYFATTMTTVHAPSNYPTDLAIALVFTLIGYARLAN